MAFPYPTSCGALARSRAVSRCLRRGTQLASIPNRSPHEPGPPAPPREPLPIVGTLLAVFLFGLALLRARDRGVWLSATVLMALAGGSAAAAKLSGEGAEEQIEGMPGVNDAVIETHEERADIATIFAVLAGIGAVAAFGLGKKREGAVLVTAPLAAAIVSGGLMAWTGAAGGQIRHPEIDAAPVGSASVPGAGREASDEDEEAAQRGQ